MEQGPLAFYFSLIHVLKFFFYTILVSGYDPCCVKGRNMLIFFVLKKKKKKKTGKQLFGSDGFAQ